MSFGRKIKEKISALQSIGHVAAITVPGNDPYKDVQESRKRLSGIEFIAVDDSCVQCGACAQHCPVGAIDPDDSASIDREKCIVCNACIKACPQHARERLSSDMIKNIALYLSRRLSVAKGAGIFSLSPLFAMHLEQYGMLIQIWLIHLIPLLLLAVPVWYVGRKRVKWSGWDFAITVGPFAVWGALMMWRRLGKEPVKCA
ncbi:MAG: 4Fe-4S binding protein [Desulfobacterales bacterium]|nr:4Fe-4S binding protein [Desulfobacterales bacterium]